MQQANSSIPQKTTSKIITHQDNIHRPKHVMDQDKQTADPRCSRNLIPATTKNHQISKQAAAQHAIPAGPHKPTAPTSVYQMQRRYHDLITLISASAVSGGTRARE